MLKVQNLNLYFKQKQLLKQINLTLSPQTCLGIIGHSGAGKSLLAKCLLALLEKPFELSFHLMQLNNQDYHQLTQKKIRQQIGIIFQNSHSSFHPLLRLLDMFKLIIQANLGYNTKQAHKLTLSLLERVGFKQPSKIANSYIHQLSGGMAQKAQIALSLINTPQYLLCDEITSSLDGQSKEEILLLIEQLKKEMGIVFISHDLSIMHHLCDEGLFLHQGIIREYATWNHLISNPQDKILKTFLWQNPC